MSTDEHLLKALLSIKQARKQSQQGDNALPQYSMKQLLESLDEYYALNILQAYCHHLNLVRISPEKAEVGEADFLLIDEICEKVKDGTIKTPLTRIYYQILLLFQSTNEHEGWKMVDFQELTHLIKAYEDQLEPEEQLEVYSYLTNFSIQRVYLGNGTYSTASFKYNNKIVNLLHDLLSEKAEVNFPPSIFRNIIIAALHVPEKAYFEKVETKGVQSATRSTGFVDAVDWATQFMDVYGPKLPAKLQDETIAFCQSALYFLDGKYEKAFNLIRYYQAGSKTFRMNLNMKALFLAACLEMRHDQPDKLREFHDKNGITNGIDTTLDSFRQLIHYEKTKKKMLNHQIEHYKRFRDLFRKLYRLTRNHADLYKAFENKKVAKEVQSLVQEIEGFYSLYRGWMLSYLKKIGATS